MASEDGISATNSADPEISDVSLPTASSSSPPEQPTLPSPAELKSQANVAFANGDYKQAHDLYSAAIASGARQKPKDNELMGILHCNRSITRFNAGEYAAAAEDAGVAMEYRPTWVKAIHRKATALAALGSFSKAAELYKLAVGLEPGTKWLKASLKKMRNHTNESPVTDEKDWMRRYKDLAPQPIRMATLVHYWNICTKKERFAALARLSELANYRFVLNEEVMNELPLERYKEIIIRDQWLEFFRALDTQRKVSVLESMWNDSSDAEKQLIMHDLTYYFQENAETPVEGDEDMDIQVVEESHMCSHDHGHSHSHGNATDAAGHVEGCPNHSGSHGHSHAHAHSHAHTHSHSHGATQAPGTS